MTELEPYCAGLLIVSRTARFWLASYDMFEPEIPVTVNTVTMSVVILRLPLPRVQLPVLPVTQLLDLPGVKEPLTVALATFAPLLTLRTVTVAWACQFFGRAPLPDSAAVVDSPLTATT